MGPDESLEHFFSLGIPLPFVQSYRSKYSPCDAVCTGIGPIVDAISDGYTPGLGEEKPQCGAGAYSKHGDRGQPWNGFARPYYDEPEYRKSYIKLLLN